MQRSACGGSVLRIDAQIPAILARVRECRAVVVTDAPGAGKTTRVPPALAVDGPVIVLQPRRIAARSLARRIAQRTGMDDWRGSGVARQVRASVRAEDGGALRDRGHPHGATAAGPAPRGLPDRHPRRVPRAQRARRSWDRARQAGLARAQRSSSAIMSATLDAAAVSAYLSGCPIVDVPGSSHPLEDPLRAGSAGAPRRCRPPCASAAGQVSLFSTRGR